MIQNSNAIFDSRRAKRNNATGIKQLNCAQLQTKVYLSLITCHCHISDSFGDLLCTEKVVKYFKIGRKSGEEETIYGFQKTFGIITVGNHI